MNSSSDWSSPSLPSPGSSSKNSDSSLPEPLGALVSFGFGSFWVSVSGSFGVACAVSFCCSCDSREDILDMASLRRVSVLILSAFSASFFSCSFFFRLSSNCWTYLFNSSFRLRSVSMSSCVLAYMWCNQSCGYMGFVPVDLLPVVHIYIVDQFTVKKSVKKWPLCSSCHPSRNHHLMC